MAIDLLQLGEKCRRLRQEILALSLEDAATRSGLDIRRLEGIEGGRIEPSGDEVLILADVYGEPVEYFITNERSASVEKASDLYRMYGGNFSSEDRQSIQTFLKLCRMENEIEMLLGSRPRTVDFQPGRFKGHFKNHGRETAEKLRAELRLGDQPIENPFHLAHMLRCHIFRRSLRNSKVSGVMLRHDDLGPCILVNYSEDLFRQHFSAAHELAHAILDNDCNVTVTFEKERDEAVQDRLHREWRANSFAAHLLFPQSVREALHLGVSHEDRTRAILRAAEVFKVNTDVVLYALEEAKRLTKAEVKLLRPGLRIGRNSKDDADLAGETDRVRARRQRHLEAGLAPPYVETCARAYREGQISRGRLADALLASPFDLDSVLVDLGYNSDGESSP